MQNLYKFVAISLVLLFSVQAQALEETGMDSRIRTMIYGKNDVFRVNSIYGFQTLVEFDPNDKIMTISMGNPNIFKIIPSGNRLFIKAQQNGQITNMTVITQTRTYQFELTSNPDTPEDIMYVVRFIYTDSMGLADTSSAAPMSLYSPIALGNNVSPSYTPDMPSMNMPSTSGMLPSAPSDAPLSLQKSGKTNLLGIPEVQLGNQQ